MQDGLAVLATVGSTAHRSSACSARSGASTMRWSPPSASAARLRIDKVAGPVGEALIMTAFGLAVAVPAVMGYNWLIRRNKAAMEQTCAPSRGDVHNVLLAGKR